MRNLLNSLVLMLEELHYRCRRSTRPTLGKPRRGLDVTGLESRILLSASPAPDPEMVQAASMDDGAGSVKASATATAASSHAESSSTATAVASDAVLGMVNDSDASALSPGELLSMVQDLTSTSTSSSATQDTRDASVSENDVGQPVEQPLAALMEAPAAPDSAIAPTLDASGTASGTAGSAADANATAELATVRHELVILDPGVQNSAALHELLLAQHDAGRDLQLVVLDANRDGVEQISEILARYHNLDAVHVLSHGTADGLQLGSTWLDAQTINHYSDAIQGWQTAFSTNAETCCFTVAIWQRPMRGDRWSTRSVNGRARTSRRAPT